MNICATETSRDTHGQSGTFSCEKTRAFVRVTNDGRWNVCTLNAAHSAYRGMGKFFDSHDAARSAYKSGAMKAIIDTAREVFAIGEN